MDFEGGLDLSLRPQFLRRRIPLLDQVLDLIKRALVQVHIEGSLERPEVKLGTAGIRVPVGGRRSADGETK
jgi:hypothetical protein